MHHHTDLYPSRTQQALDMFPRLEPVVHEAGVPVEGPLRQDELEAFERDGFLIYPGFFGADEIREFIDELAELGNDPAVKNSGGVIQEPQSEEVRSIFRVHKLSQRFDRLSRDPRLLDRARQLLGSDVYIHQSRINYKPGFKGKGFNWHSDFETWHTEDGMPRMRAVSCSIILTPNDEFNGPLMLIPGSHKVFVPCQGETPDDNYKESLRNQQLGIPSAEALAELIHQGGIRSATGPAGTLVLFECNTLHGSNANMSPYPRSNVFFVYNSIKNQPHAPYRARKRRPDFLAERQPEPLTPHRA